MSTETKTLSQFATKVTEFSSHYGSENSMSYTAGNLADCTTIYPNYGDFTQACVFRTYGKWWQRSPSSLSPIKRTLSSYVSEDFIELEYATPVYPTRVTIFETYNPGTVVRISAKGSLNGTCVDTGRQHWVTLWTGKPEDIATADRMARKFTPSIQSIDFPINILRLEFCHRHCHYYTELDAVELEGSKQPLARLYNGVCPLDEEQRSDQPLAPHYNGVGPLIEDHINNASVSPARHDMERLTIDASQADCDISAIHLEEIKSDDNRRHPHADSGLFDILPEEVIQLILAYLDIPSLCKAAQTCRLLRTHCYDPLQFTELSLKPHWAMVTDITLNNLHSRCRHLQKLDLSWCGKVTVTQDGFTSFLKACGHALLSLRLACCMFLTTGCLDSISEYCINLKELNLHGNRHLQSEDFMRLMKLTRLEYLNVYRTLINFVSLVTIIRACPDLQHLIIGSCSRILNCDDVAFELSKSCKNLRSLDVWRNKSMTGTGLRALAKHCPHLEELDLGWCGQLRSSTNCFVDLVENCRNMKKLFLTANRTFCNQDLLAIAQFCPYLEQLDILGTREVSKEAVERVLSQCPNLKFFDVSFCASIDTSTVNLWEERYPNVSIKKSFQCIIPDN